MVEGWPQPLRTPADAILFATARELLTNVAKHAHASHVEVALTRADGIARLVVTDDGTGIDPDAVDRSLALGHIGLASRRVRLESMGGSLVLRSADPTGTQAVAEVPV